MHFRCTFPVVMFAFSNSFSLSTTTGFPRSKSVALQF